MTEEILKKLFPDIKIILERVSYGGFISVFIVEIENEDLLEDKWNDISNAVAAYYQSNLLDNFEKWNIYVIYKCFNEISVGLTYRIENDRFSSRKIVHVVDKSYDEKLLNNLIVTNYITNRDLETKDKTESFLERYESQSKLWHFLSNGKIKKIKNSTKDVELVLEQIEKFLQDED